MTWTKTSPTWIFFLFFLLKGCAIYSFSGLSLPKEAKTFSMSYQSEVALGPPDLLDKFQEKLGEEITRRTPLKQVDSQGDLRLEGVIKKFKYRSIAPSKVNGKEEASLERLTIEVKVNYINPYDKETAFSKKTFSQYADMSAEANREGEQPQLISNIFTKLIQDILASMDNW